MITHLIELSLIEGESAPRDSIGCRPILPGESAWPTCQCGERMVLFLQFDIREEFGLPFEAGSHLSVFMCPEHNDAPERFEGPRLPEHFWGRRRRINEAVRFYELLLHRPGSPETTHPADPFLIPHQLRFSRRDEQANRADEPLRRPPQYPGVSLSVGETVGGIQGLKVGGQPSWAQSPEVYRCGCGAEMRFLCQVPLDWAFPKRPGAPEQPDSFSSEDYCLFLGNETYLFACEAQCDPRAVHPVVQN